MEITLAPPALGVFGLTVGFAIFRAVKKAPAGSGKIAEIGDAIHQGAMLFLWREYSISKTRPARR